MSKQEEIREGIARIGVGGINPLKNARPNENGYKTADAILEYLHSQGVVIKVDRELPLAFDADENVLTAVEYKKKLAGYAKTIPLVEG